MRELCSKSAPPSALPCQWRDVVLWALIFSLGLILFAPGCGTVPPGAAMPERTVHFVIVNLSDCEWQITLTPTGGGPVRVLHPAARESQELDVAGGSYGIEQTALSGSTGADSTRQFTIRLEAGQTYRWRLVTLLSASVDGTRRDAPNDQNERR